jgi:hypothetical protein
MTLRVLRAYAPWQLRDLLPRAVVPAAICVVLGGLPVYATVHAQRGTPAADPVALRNILTLAYVGVVPLALTIGAFLFMIRSIAQDRERQYVRFLFSHAVAPASFYLSRYVVGLVTFLLCFLPVPLLVRQLGADVPVLGSLVAMVAALTLIGGLATLCAALWTRDGLAVVLVSLITQSLQRLGAQDVLSDWLQPIVRGLPPIDTLGSVVDALVRGGAWPTTDLIHVIGYGLGLLVAGLLLVRRAPLVR